MGGLTMLRTLILVALMVGTSTPAGAQWFQYPSPGAPRTASGEIDLSGTTPRLANGKPDLSGVWMAAESTCGRVMGPTSLSRLLELAPPSLKCPARLPTIPRTGFNIGVDLPGRLPCQPWPAALVQHGSAYKAKPESP